MIQIDMEMPKSCMECRFNATGCAAAGKRFDHPLDYPGADDPYELLETQRMPWCPLIDVPDVSIGQFKEEIQHG